MKKFFIWLGEITGAAEQIRIEQRASIASRIEQGSYCYSDFDKYGVILPVLKKLSQRIPFSLSLYGHEIRQEVDEWISLHERGLLKQELEKKKII